MSAHHEGESHHHIVSVSVYLAIFAALLVGTALTVWVAYFDLGAFNIVVALAIAVTKASLVVLYFMHVKYSSKLVQLAACTGFIWLAIMIGFTFSDVFTRDWQPAEGFAPQPIQEFEASGEDGHHEAAGEH